MLRYVKNLTEIPAPDGTIFRVWLDTKRLLWVGQQFEAGEFSGDLAIGQPYEAASELTVLDDVWFAITELTPA